MPAKKKTPTKKAPKKAAKKTTKKIVKSKGCEESTTCCPNSDNNVDF